MLECERRDETWNLDDLEEFLGELSTKPRPTGFDLICTSGEYSLHLMWLLGDFHVSVQAPTKGEILTVVNLFNDAAVASRLPKRPEVEAKPLAPVVFIGHGHSTDWRKIKDHLQDLHGYKVEAYEVGSRAGHSIRDVLDSMLDKSSFALLVMTAEDAGEGERMRARQNVVHEAGLFQGRLGFQRAIAVVENGVEVFSNLNGVDQIRYPSNHVENTFGAILAVLRREFGDAR